MKKTKCCNQPFREKFYRIEWMGLIAVSICNLCHNEIEVGELIFLGDLKCLLKKHYFLKMTR